MTHCQIIAYYGKRRDVMFMTEEDANPRRTKAPLGEEQTRTRKQRPFCKSKREPENILCCAYPAPVTNNNQDESEVIEHKI